MCSLNAAPSCMCGQEGPLTLMYVAFTSHLSLLICIPTMLRYRNPYNEVESLNPAMPMQKLDTISVYPSSTENAHEFSEQASLIIKDISGT